MMSHSSSPENLPERNESIWLLTLSPVMWSLHLLASYVTAAVYCAKFSGDAEGFLTVRWLVGGYTLVAMALIAIVGWSGYHRHRHGLQTLPHDLDTPGDRHRFLGFATLLLSLLSGVATLFVAMVFVLIRNCD